MDSSSLEDLFTRVGNVLSARVVCEGASSLGRGFVEMSTREEAENGALHFNGQVVSGCKILVRLNELVATKPAARRPANLSMQNRVRRIVKEIKR